MFDLILYFHISLTFIFRTYLSFVDPHRSPCPPRWLVQWVDYTTKYGLGYRWSDGAVGVRFNDRTSFLLAPDEMCVLYHSDILNLLWLVMFCISSPIFAISPLPSQH